MKGTPVSGPAVCGSNARISMRAMLASRRQRRHLSTDCRQSQPVIRSSSDCGKRRREFSHNALHKSGGVGKFFEREKRHGRLSFSSNWISKPFYHFGLRCFMPRPIVQLSGRAAVATGRVRPRRDIHLCRGVVRNQGLSGIEVDRTAARHDPFFSAAMMSARSFTSLIPTIVFVVPGRNLAGAVRYLSRSASVQAPPAWRSAGE